MKDIVAVHVIVVVEVRNVPAECQGGGRIGCADADADSGRPYAQNQPSASASRLDGETDRLCESAPAPRS